MRIVIDMQSVQSKKQDLDIRHNIISLVKTMLQLRGEHEIILVLSSLFSDTIKPIRAEFHGLLAEESIRVWHALGPVHGCDKGSIWRREVAELIRESYIASLKPDVVFVPSFFESFEDDVVTSVGVHAKDLVTAVVVDQLDISAIECGNPYQEKFTLRKLEQLKRANLLLTTLSIKESEILQRFGVSQQNVQPCLIVDKVKNNQAEVNIDAKELLHILEQAAIQSAPAFQLPLSVRPRLAYISPLPPERSGISDYSAELLPELACFYDIDVIVSQEEISTPWIGENCGVRTVDWFVENSQNYNRVLYHFGNSHYHHHMFHLLRQVSGVVVLHDFYLSGAVKFCEARDTTKFAFTRALYDSHGYMAVAERFRIENDAFMANKYPVNFEVLQQAQGIIGHSEHSRQLAVDWYGRQLTEDWKVIPLLRVPSSELNRNDAREALGLKVDDFVVCSYGLLGETKLNHRLLESWLNSNLAQDKRCILVFVGENDRGEYGAQLVRTIGKSKQIKRIRITGWVDMDMFKHYLAVANVAVQLRGNSRGETSAAVLDCMNHGLPTIVNGNGSMAELPIDAVWMLPDDFDNEMLIEALESLWRDKERRKALAKRAQQHIWSRHAPQACAKQYVAAIEQMYAHRERDCDALVKAISDIESYSPTNAECIDLAKSIGHTLPLKKAKQQLFIDVSATLMNDLKTGIQRVVRALVLELIKAPPQEYRIEPVYLSDEGGAWHYRYARQWTLSVLGLLPEWLQDEPITYSVGDLMLVADYTGNFVVEAERAGIYTKLKEAGVNQHFVVYDLLPIQMPEVFPHNTIGYVEWLNAVCRIADSAVCISSAVADELQAWVKEANPQRSFPMDIGWFHLGADVENSMPSFGVPKDAQQKLTALSAVPSFLMVGTIEPRKGYLQTIEAFSRLWEEGVDVNLVIVGKEGWKGLPDNERRTIPEIVKVLRNHPELDKHLFWLEGISDEYLDKIYKASTCLIAASEGEGFGLPLIEAAQHKLPIIARDIKVFKEVAGDHAYYFSGLAPDNLAQSVLSWLELYREKKHPLSEAMPWLTWKQSTQQLLSKILVSK